VTAHIIRGDARNLPLPDSSVDLIVTSPPFLNLRSYQDGGEHYDGQIGIGTQQEYLESLWEVTAECKRVLKPSGSMFVELGDSYTGKSLNNSPHRYAIGCTDRLGLLQRAEIVWSRSNGLPESVTDRVRRSHSVWFHFVRQPRYFSGIDHIREAHSVESQTHVARYTGRDYGKLNTDRVDKGASNFVGNPLGKLPGSVWTIPTQPLIVPPELGVDHFAAFPMEWPRRFIRGWSPSGVCTACGEGRRPVAVTARTIDGQPVADLGAWQRGGKDGPSGIGNWRFGTDRRITGEACACTPTRTIPEVIHDGWVEKECVEYDFAHWNPPPTTPSVILDPFGGTGTTALVAKVEGRTGVSVDMSADYCRLARWRTTDPGQIAAAMQVDKPAKPIEGQLDMFGEMLA
jgi:DNA modification methylase